MSGQVARIRPGNTRIIAPCGLNCGVCYAYLRPRDPCSGCRGSDEGKAKYCLTCVIRTCEERAEARQAFCAACSRFPCTRLRDLDRRYRTRYGVSLKENLARIESAGVKAFLAEDRAKWTCSRCGVQLCMHSAECPGCGHSRRVPRL